MPRVPYVNFPAQYEAEKEQLDPAIRKVLANGDFILGKSVDEFEARFAELCHTKHAISVANGTDALILALKVLGIGPGDEVVTVPNSWISSASAIALVGAKPVFVDVLPDQNMDPSLLAKALNKRTKAIMPVHLTGRACRMDEISAIARDHAIPVLEDAAQSILAEHKQKRVGSLGDMAAFSLHPLKNLNACGDAGIITTNNSDFAAQLRLLRNHGQVNRDEVVVWGYNSRLDTLQAAILNTRLGSLAETIKKRRANAALYRKLLGELVVLPPERADEYHTYHVFVAQVDQRDPLQAFLHSHGVETKVHYPTPIHLQKAAEYLGHGPGSFPVAETQAKRILSLPIHQYLREEDIIYTCEKIREFYKERHSG